MPARVSMMAATIIISSSENPLCRGDFPGPATAWLDGFDLTGALDIFVRSFANLDHAVTGGNGIAAPRAGADTLQAIRGQLSGQVTKVSEWSYRAERSLQGFSNNSGRVSDGTSSNWQADCRRAFSPWRSRRARTRRASKSCSDRLRRRISPTRALSFI